jgi:sigma-E factor negative regulatory protein RseB
MIARSLSIVCSFLILSAPLACRAEDDVFQWLERMSAAMNQMNYQGTFVYVRDNTVESMRITHVVDGQGLHERLVSVSGTPREIVRDADGVRWTSGEEGTVLADAEASRTLFPELPLGDLRQISTSYELRLGDDYRVAGHSGKRLDIVPKDEYRYGYSLWLEAESNLLLQWELTGGKGQTLAKLMFTDLRMGSEVDKGELRSSSTGTRQARSDAAPAGQAVAGLPPKWQPARIPPGFHLTSHHVQQSQHGNPYEHYVYSDGIAVVSVYVEAAEPDPERPSGLGKLGTTHVFSRELDGDLITVLGDVPAATVRLIGESIGPVSKD